MKKCARKLLAVLALCAASLGGGSVYAQEFGISEIRGGVYAHNVYRSFIPVKPELWNGINDIEDLNVELLFNSPDIDFFRWIGSPRPALGATFSTVGRESIAYLGLTWHAQLFDSDFFVEGTLGGGVHDGGLVNSTGRDMGCRVGFYESGSIGMDLTDNITAMVTYEHMSNWNLCPANDGLSNLGIRIGYKF